MKSLICSKEKCCDAAGKLSCVLKLIINKSNNSDRKLSHKVERNLCHHMGWSPYAAMLLTEQFRISWKTTLHLVASLYCLVVISDRPFQLFLMVLDSNLSQPPLEEAIFGNMLRSIICIKICVLNNHQICRILHAGFWRLEQAQILTITHQQFPSHPTW